VSAAPSTLELRADEERREATCALLAEPFVGSEQPVYRLVRRHEPELARRFADFWGYRLEVTPGFARLFKRPTAAALRRGLRIPPGTPSGRERPRDEWPALDRRRAVLLLLAAAALERSPQQTVIGDLAREVAEAGARCDPPLAVDFERRAERVAFADALDLLCHWGVLRLEDGSRQSFARREQGDDEALFTIDRKRLATLMRDPFAVLGVHSLAELEDDRHDYAPTEQGATRRVRHRLARMLAEDPAVYIEDLSEEERAYLAGQWAYLRERIAAYTGLAPERRGEGVACVEGSRLLTDLPFPANSTRKQVALLLCDLLAARAVAGAELVPREELLTRLRTLVERHGSSWNRSTDADDVAALLDDATGVLEAFDLARSDPHGLRPLPLCGRFRDPVVQPPKEP
jgi:uncharacterized protein (TIGR02678 family)